MDILAEIIASSRKIMAQVIGIQTGVFKIHLKDPILIPPARVSKLNLKTLEYSKCTSPSVCASA